MSTTAVQQSSTDATAGAWRSFVAGPWSDGIDVRDFIQRNYTPYPGDASFLAGPTPRTTGIWATLSAMFPQERERGVYDIDNHTPGTITSHGAGYIDQANELIVGLQTDAPLKRAMIPNGGWRMVETSLQTYGFEIPQDIKKIFTEYRKTHNAGVFDVYPPNVRAARSSHIITGLPDAYGRGRIIGDYRRVALYGIDGLIAAKKIERAELDMERSVEDVIRDARRTRSRSARCRSSRRWPPPTASTSLRPQRRPVRPSSGCTSPTWVRSRSRTVRRCRSVAPRPSSTSTCSATSP